MSVTTLVTTLRRPALVVIIRRRVCGLRILVIAGILLALISHRLHLRFLVCADFAWGQRAVLVGVDRSEDLVDAGGRLVLGDLSVLVGVELLEHDDEPFHSNIEEPQRQGDADGDSDF